ncbi:MAG: hypothetical protein DWQ19_08980 [Crenarchaeota archaeon]|nr:MAG: hypothetical protein DWQ19_08980 [Thermoproteota archaeon]
MKYYKIVVEIDGKLLSASAAWIPPSLWENRIVEYKINNWTKPKIRSKLFAFEDATRAKVFARESYPNDLKITPQLYECKLQNPLKTIVAGYMPHFHNSDPVKSFWESELGMKLFSGIELVGNDFYTSSTITCLPAPIGTLVADAIKLKKKVE